MINTDKKIDLLEAETNLLKAFAHIRNITHADRIESARVECIKIALTDVEQILEKLAHNIGTDFEGIK